MTINITTKLVNLSVKTATQAAPRLEAATGSMKATGRLANYIAQGMFNLGKDVVEGIVTRKIEEDFANLAKGGNLGSTNAANVATKLVDMLANKKGLSSMLTSNLSEIRNNTMAGHKVSSVNFSTN